MASVYRQSESVGPAGNAVQSARARVEALVWRAVTVVAFAAVVGLMFVHPVGAMPAAPMAASHSG